MMVIFVILLLLIFLFSARMNFFCCEFELWSMFLLHTDPIEIFFLPCSKAYYVLLLIIDVIIIITITAVFMQQADSVLCKREYI